TGAGDERMMKVVPVIPQVALESWLLADVQKIKEVAGNPAARGDLGLPKVRAIERAAAPKRLLQDALASASGLSGRRLMHFNKRFADMRYRLTIARDVAGPVTGLQSYREFRNHLQAVLDRIAVNMRRSV